MTEKRFNIKQSSIIDNCSVIIDSESEYGFPTLESTLNFMFCKALNELNDENKELRLLVDSLKQQNKKFKGRLNDLGVEYY